MAEYWQEKLQSMHRRAQAAEGELQRMGVWLGFHEEDCQKTGTSRHIRGEKALWILERIMAERATRPNTQTEQEKP